MAPNDESLVSQIRDRLAGSSQVETLLAEYLTFVPGHGPERMAFCPFHENTHSPSLSVNVDEGLYDCKNPACGASGDLFSLVQRRRSLTFPEAVHELALRVGLDPDGLRDSGPAGRPVVDPAREAAILAAYVPGSLTEADLEALNAGLAAPRPRLAPPPEGRRATKADEPEPIIPDDIPAAYHQRLLASDAQLRWLEDARGLSRETIIRAQLGHDGTRYSIPVRDTGGVLRNIRRYLPNCSDSAIKMKSWRPGFGKARLYPLDRLDPEGPIYLLEGEMDTLLARQHGLNAVTGTTGAGTWRQAWAPPFVGRDVVICYDCDEAGRIGAAAVARELHAIAASVKIVKLPLAEEGADFTDYIVKRGMTKEDFCKLVDETPVYTPTDRDSRQVAAQEPTPLHLSQASEAAYYNAPIRTNVMVSGKTTAPYMVPREVKLSCSMPALKMCQACPVSTAAGTLVHGIEFASNEVLQFINVPESTVVKLVRAKTGVPPKCGYVKQDVLTAMNIEEIHLIPEVERREGEEGEAPYVTRQSYYLGHGLQANRSYVMTGITVPDPKKQLATHLITDAVPSQSNIDAFRLTAHVVQRLRAFQPTLPGRAGLEQHLQLIYDDLECQTRIYQRRDIMLAVDLVFHSLIGFVFQGDRVRRGWTEALIVGDSRTGKSTIVERMVAHYGAGELTTGENTSFAGLVGGLEQIGTSWSLRWGRVPLNDRRLLVIDEAGNLSQEHIGRMSSMRSSGVAEVIKIHTERTLARTRQIWISNPRNNRSLSSYSQGVIAIKELIGAPEDIARFDLPVTAASTDVPLHVVNLSREKSAPQTFTGELCHQLVMWAWSRNVADVVWAPGAEDTVLRIAGEHGEKYRHATEIPIVEPNEQRIKIARLAVATAVRFFSTDPTGREVIVRSEHAEMAAAFLEQLYAKPSLAFDEYAIGMKRRNAVSDEEAVRKVVHHRKGAVQALLEQEYFSQRDFEEIFGYDDRNALREALSVLRDAGFLKRNGNSTYVKTPGAIRWLRDELNRVGPSGDFFGYAGAATNEQALSRYKAPSSADFHARQAAAHQAQTAPVPDDLEPSWDLEP